VPAWLWAQADKPAYNVKANYDRIDAAIPMRDGKHLFTVIYFPKRANEKFPILLNRTPYGVGPYDPDQMKPSLGHNELLMKSGYIYVFQDVRGRYMSEGDFMDVRPFKPRKSGKTDVDESTDTYDTIEWLLKKLKARTNGKVGMWGISYGGFYTTMGLLSNHPNLVAASPQAPVSDWFTGDDFHHNGAFFLPHAFNFLASFGIPRTGLTPEGNPPFQHGTYDGYKFFLNMGPLPNANRKYLEGLIPMWNDLMYHGTYDLFWKERNVLQHLAKIKAAVLTVGGWWDAENLYGALQVYKNIEAKNPKNNNSLVMGPWYHGAWARSDGDKFGSIDFENKTAKFFREKIEYQFFQLHLKGLSDIDLPEAYLFQTGSNNWKAFAEWPPKNAQPYELYFFPNGKLDVTAEGLESGNSGTEYISDPTKPVPFTQTITTGMNKEFMVENQVHNSRRPDVLVFETAPLIADVTLAGPIQADLFINTSATDLDLIVKVIDVFPDDAPKNSAGEPMSGYQLPVRWEVMRSKFRNSLETPEALPANEPVNVKFNLNDVCHTFKKGHKLMVQVQSSWFPLIDRNPQTFTDIYRAKPDDFVKARVKLLHSSRYTSTIKALRIEN